MSENKEIATMIKLSTIQKRENLNYVFVDDEKGNGGANHKYEIYRDNLVDVVSLKHEMVNLLSVQFQNGPRNGEGSVDGVLDTDLLEIVRHRLKCFQEGPYSSEYNAKALEHLEIALMYLNRRVEDRIERGVLGTNNK